MATTYILESGTPYIRTRTEKGWTLDFVFNRDGNSWSDGSTFYYWGISGETEQRKFADNNLSFSFTDDGRIKWEAYRYSGVCETATGYTELYYISSGQTPQLCTTDANKDFNVTIVFDRYKKYSGCDLKNSGGKNDMLGWQINEYQDTEVSAVTSTQLMTYESEDEFLNKKWSNERYRRLGVLKIYLNGRPIYKLEDWEEVIPTKRGSEKNLIQTWGGGTTGYLNIHTGETQFNILEVTYTEQPLDFIQIRNNFLTKLNDFDFYICGADCEDDVIGLITNGVLTEINEDLLTEDNVQIIY